MLKKSMVTTFSLALMVTLGHNSASAMEVLVTDLEDENLVVELSEAKDNFIKEKAFEEITPFLSVQVSSSSLGVNQYAKSNIAYYIKKGEMVSIKSVTWNPTGQKVQVGLIHATTGAQYWSDSFSGGSITGGSFTLPLTASDGNYYLAIGTPSTNTTNINVSGLFDF
ncbi:hypothetical protein ACIQXF_11795 [Lysinibacillus sp. NPDC097231]|uniref:hypothetical protein n=1 Tax=Lysinibacillus sp. NPDC097231 TaxID=3364142 RepID=UPI0037FAE5AD